MVAWHDERGLMDYVTCGTGSYFDFAPLMPTSLYPARLGEPFAAALKAVVSHAVVQAESHIRTPAGAEEVLAAGHADMVSIVRGQIADPHLVAKARTGREDEVRPCISCNQLCWGRRSRDYWISCLVNPSAGREGEWGGDRFVPDPPASGCSWSVAARPAWRRHGSPPSAATRSPSGRPAASWAGSGGWRATSPRTQVLDHLAWYERELTRLDVDVRVGQALDAATVRAAAADDIVVAVGARPAANRLPAGLAHGRPAARHRPASGWPASRTYWPATPPRRTGAARRRPRGLEGHRHGPVPPGGGVPRDPPDLGTGGGDRPVPQRR